MYGFHWRRFEKDKEVLFSNEKSDLHIHVSSLCDSFCCLCRFCKTVISRAVHSWRSWECPLEEFCLHCSYTLVDWVHRPTLVQAELWTASISQDMRAKFRSILSFSLLNSDLKSVLLIIVRAGLDEMCAHVCLVAQWCPLCDSMNYMQSARILSMEFSRQGYWSGLSFPTAGALPDPEIKPVSPAWQMESLPLEPPGKPRWNLVNIINYCEDAFLSAELIPEHSTAQPPQRDLTRKTLSPWCGQSSLSCWQEPLVPKRRISNPYKTILFPYLEVAQIRAEDQSMPFRINVTRTLGKSGYFLK